MSITDTIKSALRGHFVKGQLKSPWVVHYDCGSCNGCDIEVLACLTPVFDIERFGILNIGNPKHADVLLVTGTVNHRNKHVLKNLYEQMPEPRAVIAIGACACSGGVFQDCYNVVGGVDQVIPVDVYVPGCAAKPEAIIDGVVVALDAFKAKLTAKPVVAKPDTEQAEKEATAEQAKAETTDAAKPKAEEQEQPQENLNAEEPAATEPSTDTPQEQEQPK